MILFLSICSILMLRSSGYKIEDCNNGDQTKEIGDKDGFCFTYINKRLEKQKPTYNIEELAKYKDPKDNKDFKEKQKKISKEIGKQTGIEYIGSGGYGNVFSCLINKDREIKVALKEIVLDPTSDNIERYTEAVNNELDILKKLTDGENSAVPKLHYCYYNTKLDQDQEKKIIYIFEEFVLPIKDIINKYKVVTELIDSHDNKFTSKHPKDLVLTFKGVVIFFQKAAEALKSLHDKNIIHFDIKPDNMAYRMIEKTDKFNDYEIVILDYGISEEILSPQNPKKGKKGTSGYIDPLMNSKKNKRTIKNDVYSLGIVFCEVIFGKVCIKPNEDKEYRSVSENFFNSSFNDVPNPTVDFVNKRIRKLIDTKISQMRDKQSCEPSAQDNLDSSISESSCGTTPLQIVINLISQISKIILGMLDLDIFERLSTENVINKLKNISNNQVLNFYINNDTLKNVEQHFDSKKIEGESNQEQNIDNNKIFDSKQITSGFKPKNIDYPNFNTMLAKYKNEEFKNKESIRKPDIPKPRNFKINKKSIKNQNNMKSTQPLLKNLDITPQLKKDLLEKKDKPTIISIRNGVSSKITQKSNRVSDNSLKPSFLGNHVGDFNQSGPRINENQYNKNTNQNLQQQKYKINEQSSPILNQPIPATNFFEKRRKNQNNAKDDLPLIEQRKHMNSISDNMMASIKAKEASVKKKQPPLQGISGKITSGKDNNNAGYICYSRPQVLYCNTTLAMLS